ncbi:MAG TPA: NAD-dependent succinate-semialdehyde dehydrogenase [Tepidisphaeraceae bacterium]|nr:NAD-dependent succinate-semialdehyde dehydrogenase [Tepidisphaeraceae bacterium]
MDIKQNYLNGQWIGGGETIEIVNPATGQPFAKVSSVTSEQVRQALADAQTAFDPWRRLPAKARGDYLLAIASELNRRSDEVARVMTQENGKPLAQSKGEVAMSVDHLRWFAEECRRAYGRVIPQQVAGKRNLVLKSPVGVVAAISPWNFPLVLSVRKIAPALAAGCPTILKPASQTPLCNLAFAECCEAAKLPKGVFQLINGSASMISEAFLASPICRKITFTGSTEVGQKLIAGAARDVKKLSLELGGHAPAIVFDDADLGRTVEGVLAAKFRNTGQSCIAANRIYVQARIYDRFVAAFVDRVKQLKTGDGLEGEQDVGPVVNEKAIRFALAQIEDAKRRGARVLAGGRRLDRAGFFLEPTVLENVPDDAACMNEETFAPIAPIARFEREEEAIAKANASPFGLSAYAFTTNLDRMFRVAEQLEAGTIGINDGVPTTSNAPFGGFKHSGWGRELGSEGLDAFLETKHVSIGIVESSD